MEKRKLGNTDLSVSKICLGTMTWGEQNSEEEAHLQLDYAVEHGINFIDTAELYPIPSRGETQGRTESYIGSWLRAGKNRDQIVLASKVAGPGEWVSHIRGGPRLNREHMQQALDASLKRLQTDYIDLYQVHWPERSTNYFGKLEYGFSDDIYNVAIEETLEVLQSFVESGKVRHLGVSNETPWGVSQYLKHTNLGRIQSIQNPFSLLNRSFEIGLAEFSHREKVGLLAYSPLGFGVLTGKYLGGNFPKGSRLQLFQNYSRYSTVGGIEATSLYVKLAKKYDLTPAQLALSFVNDRPFVTSNIIGATSIEQLQENISSHSIRLSPEILGEIEKIHRYLTNPCP